MLPEAVIEMTWESSAAEADIASRDARRASQNLLRAAEPAVRSFATPDTALPQVDPSRKSLSLCATTTHVIGSIGKLLAA